MSDTESSRPGSVLRAEREALGVTVREVAETLNLSMTVIEAIEADDRERLPGPVFARGYVRAYARLLELPPEPLLAQYPRAPDTVPTVAAAAEAPMWEWIRRRPGLVLGGAAGVGVLVLVLLVGWLWPDAEPVPAIADTAAESAAGVEEAATAEAPDGPAVVDDFPFDTSAPVATRPAADAGTTAPSDTALAAPAPDEGAATSARPSAIADGDARRITPTGTEHLTFVFADDCWVEVRNADGRTLYSDLNRAESTLELVGQGPFRILLGYAPGVQLKLNGESVPLAPHTRDNVATLVLGQ